MKSRFYIKNFLKKIIICIIVISVLPLTISCKKEVEIKKAQAVIEEELPYEKIPDISEDEFDNLILKVRDQIMVFDIVEVHDEIFPDLKSNVDINVTDENIEIQIAKIIDPFMEEWTTNKIRDYLTKELGEISEDDIEKFKDKIDNKLLIEIIIIYEKNYLKGTK